MDRQDLQYAINDGTESIVLALRDLDVSINLLIQTLKNTNTNTNKDVY